MPAIRPLAALLCAALVYDSAHAQQTTLTYDISTETAVGSGDYTAYQLVSNRHHILSTRANTGYLRAALTGEHRICEHWSLSGAVDAVASLHADHPAYLQQCYLNLSWREFYLEAGTRERGSVMRNDLLTSGALISSDNAKPIPQLRLGTLGFWTVPGLRNWLQVFADGSYGHFLGDDWAKDRFSTYQSLRNNSFVTTQVWYHQKRLYLRTDPMRRIYFSVGMEHAVQFGGTKLGYETGSRELKETSPSFSDFLKVFIPQSDGTAKTNAADAFVFGNHLGSWNLQLAWNMTPVQDLKFGYECPFEDGSGIRMGNAYDGLWSLEYSNRQEGVLPLRGIVFEYLRTLNQSGPIHWAPDDFDAEVRDRLPNHATGNDNYYNNYYYNGYAHYGMSLGSALLMSPIYNQEGYLCFTDNRVEAWHLAANGDLTSHVDYLLKGSYRQGYGTYFVPLASRHHSLDLMAQCRYQHGSWHYSVAVGFTNGNIYGDCTTFDLKITYHGRIL